MSIIFILNEFPMPIIKIIEPHQRKYNCTYSKKKSKFTKNDKTHPCIFPTTPPQNYTAHD